jgi:serine/threonine-protein kinase
MTAYGFVRPDEVMPVARAAAEQAIRFDPDSAEAHKSLAWIRSHYDWCWEEAGDLYRRALTLSPGYSEARHWYAVDYLTMLGRFDEAIPHLQIACDLDPLSLVNREGKGYLLMLARRNEQAIVQYKSLLEFDPSFYKAYSGYGRVLLQCGRYDEAVQMFLQARTLASDVPNILGALGQAYALNGQQDRARATLAELENLAGTRYAPRVAFAMIHLGLGEYDNALNALESSADRHDLSLSALNVHPAYDPLRASARFRRLLERVGFTVS